MKANPMTDILEAVRLAKQYIEEVKATPLNQRLEKLPAVLSLQLAEALLALHAAQPVWRTIESAPKDGTEVLVWTDVATTPVVHIAWYRCKEEWEKSGQYCGGWETLEDWEGWWSYTEHSVTQTKLVDFLTPQFWMPLPAAPTELQGGAEVINKGENNE